MSKKIQKILGKLEEIHKELEILQEEMQDTYDNRSERWQESEKGEEYMEQIDALEDAASSVRDAIDYLSDYSE